MVYGFEKPYSLIGYHFLAGDPALLDSGPPHDRSFQKAGLGDPRLSNHLLAAPVLQPLFHKGTPPFLPNYASGVPDLFGLGLVYLRTGPPYPDRHIPEVRTRWHPGVFRQGENAPGEKGAFCDSEASYVSGAQHDFSGGLPDYRYLDRGVNSRIGFFHGSRDHYSIRRKRITETLRR